jgi:hypothetical protein
MSCRWWTSYKIHIQPTTDFSQSTVASVLTDAPFIQPVVHLLLLFQMLLPSIRLLLVQLFLPSSRLVLQGLFLLPIV